MASIRHTHEVLAWEYDQRNGDASSDEIARYTKYTGMSSDRVLELGCGRLLIPLAVRGNMIDGVDIAPAMLDRLAAKFHENGMRLSQRIRTLHGRVDHKKPDKKSNI